MWKKSGLIALGMVTIGFAAAPRANAGTEVVEPHYAPAPSYSYAPPPPPPPPIVYYAPRPIPVIVAPAFGYVAPSVRIFGVRRFCGRRVYYPPHR